MLNLGLLGATVFSVLYIFISGICNVYSLLLWGLGFQ